MPPRGSVKPPRGKVCRPRACCRRRGRDFAHGRYDGVGVRERNHVRGAADCLEFASVRTAMARQVALRFVDAMMG